MKLSVQHAYTVVEVVVVVTVLAVLAAMFIPRIAGAQEDTRVVATARDLGIIARAFEYYKANNGYWPVDSEPGRMPPEMRGLFKQTNPFDAHAPLGGVYNYEYSKSSPAVIIAITGTEAHPAPTLEDALALDVHMDDGNLLTGNFRSGNKGYEYAFSRK